MCNGRRFPRPAKHEGGPTPVAGRVSPTERLRAEIDELFASDRELASILEDVARLSVRAMLQTAWRLRSRSSWAEPATSGAPPRAGPGPGTAGRPRGGGGPRGGG